MMRLFQSVRRSVLAESSHLESAKLTRTFKRVLLPTPGWTPLHTSSLGSKRARAHSRPSRNPARAKVAAVCLFEPLEIIGLFSKVSTAHTSLVDTFPLVLLVQA